MSFEESLLTWHRDGHFVEMSLSGPELLAVPEECPYQVVYDANCKAGGKCLFEYYVGVYGMDLNVGSTELSPRIEFAWALQGNPDDLDSAQLWIIPVDDPTFGPWLASFERIAEPETSE